MSVTKRLSPSFTALLCGCVLIALAGCSRRGLPDTRNPYYLRGQKLLGKHKYNEAAQAFEKCLRLNPNSPKANLQLGILYEDIFGEPENAIYHYNCYLKAHPDGDNSTTVRHWLKRAELTYLKELHARYPETVLKTNVKEQPSSPSQKQVETPAQPVSEREKKLATRLKALNTELILLQEKLKTKAAVVKAPSSATPLPVKARGKVATAKKGEPRLYAVVPGDTLSKLSRKFYGTSQHWPQLRDHNRKLLKGGDILVPGMLLQIPVASEFNINATEVKKNHEYKIPK